ncbi:MAG TPA: hypothetical protein VFG45_03410 [Candidatus Nitrosocosmicus sp.]|nr:hypothetical protein [Candidatus Nitrosocosmicus sp.]
MIAKTLYIPSIIGYSLEDAAANNDKVKLGFKRNCNDEFPGKAVMLTSLLEDFVYPYVFQKIRENRLPPNFRLTHAHFIMDTSGKCNQILFNEEVRFLVHVKLQQDEARKPNDPVHLKDIEDVLGLYPSKKNNPNAAHIMLFRTDKGWHLAFDFFYNKRQHLDKLKHSLQFLEAAKLTFDENLQGPCVDLQYSSIELAIQSIMLFDPKNNFENKKKSHPGTYVFFKEFIESTYIEKKYWDHYLYMKNLRSDGRYLNNIRQGGFDMDPSLFTEHMNKTAELIEYCRDIHSEIDATMIPDGEYIGFINL